MVQIGNSYNHINFHRQNEEAKRSPEEIKESNLDSGPYNRKTGAIFEKPIDEDDDILFKIEDDISSSQNKEKQD
jgi:hypothetical protein